MSRCLNAVSWIGFKGLHYQIHQVYAKHQLVFFNNRVIQIQDMNFWTKSWLMVTHSDSSLWINHRFLTRISYEEVSGHGLKISELLHCQLSAPFKRRNLCSTTNLLLDSWSKLFLDNELIPSVIYGKLWVGLATGRTHTLSSCLRPGKSPKVSLI